MNLRVGHFRYVPKPAVSGSGRTALRDRHMGGVATPSTSSAADTVALLD
jgi:hypothetical protein